MWVRVNRGIGECRGYVTNPKLGGVGCRYRKPEISLIITVQTFDFVNVCDSVSCRTFDVVNS